MAEAIARGIELEDPKVKVKLFNSSKVDKNDIITEVFKSKESYLEHQQLIMVITFYCWYY